MAKMITKSLTAHQIREGLYIAAKALEAEAAKLRADMPNLAAEVRGQAEALESMKRELAMNYRDAALDVSE